MNGKYITMPLEEYEDMQLRAAQFDKAIAAYNDLKKDYEFIYRDRLKYQEAHLLACEVLANISKEHFICENIGCPFRDSKCFKWGENRNCGNECESGDTWAKHFINNTHYIKKAKEGAINAENNNIH